MPTKPLDRLMFAQGGRCFFCKESLPKAEASVEHLLATANGGTNDDENCVACCKALNALLGSMSLKEKLQVILNQQRPFKCPNGGDSRGVPAILPATAVLRAKVPAPNVEKIVLIVEDLRKRGAARPRTIKTLSSTIAGLFKKKLTEHEIVALVETLRLRGIIAVNETKVTYVLPVAGALSGGKLGRKGI